MNAEIILRAIYATGIVAAGLGVYWLVNKLFLLQAYRKYRGLESRLPNIPAILYFTTPNCAPCKTIQQPALKQLQAHVGAAHLQVIEVDAAADPDLANYWGVLSVPTTFIIDSQGRPRRVNHGVVRAEKLYQQLTAVEADASKQRYPVLKPVQRTDGNR